MSQTFWVNTDATGANNGTSWANAWDNSDGTHDLQTAMNQADNAQETLIYFGFSGSTTNLPLAAPLDVTKGGSLYGVTPQNNLWLKIIGVDSSGNAILTRGTRVKIISNASIDECVTYSSAPDRVAWYNIDFDANSGQAGNALDMPSDTGLCYWHGFINCKFQGGSGPSWDWDSDGRNTYCYDCDFHSEDDQSATFNNAGMIFVNCRFYGNGDTYNVGASSDYSPLFYGCLFDTEGGSYNIRSSANYLNGNYINCVFKGATIADFWLNQPSSSPVLINCVLSVASKDNDFVFSRVNTNDGYPEFCLGNVFNADGTATDRKGTFSELADLLTPYKTLTALNVEAASGDVISSADPRWDTWSEVYNKGALDLVGNYGYPGIENLNPAKVRGRSRQIHV